MKGNATDLFQTRTGASPMKKHKRITSRAVATVMFMVIAKSAMAKYLFIIGITATVVGILTLPTVVIPTVAGVVQVVGVVSACGGILDDFQPSFVSSASSEGPDSVCSASIHHSILPELPLPGDADDPLYAALNTA